MVLEIILVCILGTLFHFTYELSNHNKYVALFSAVNESTWEHIKIALSSTFILSLFDGFIYGFEANYFYAKALSLMCVILIIPVIFYTYTFFLKKSILLVDILIFYIDIIISQVVFYISLNTIKMLFYINYFSLIVIFIIFSIYLIGTLLPFKNFLFKDPITKKYGIKGHTHM